MENTENKQMKPSTRRKSLVFGSLLLGFGLAWLLRNFGMMSDPVAEVIFSWQMIVIAVGVINVANGTGRGFGMVLILVGGFFLLSDIYDLPITFRRAFWPSLLILVGVFIMFGSRRLLTKKHRSANEGDDFIEEVAVFGGGERMVHSRNLKGGSIVAVFGGSTLDLTDVELAPGEPVIEVVAVFGGSTIIVPRDWNVKIDVFNIFGGYSDKRLRSTINFDKTIVIKGVAVFGGGEIKSA